MVESGPCVGGEACIIATTAMGLVYGHSVSVTLIECYGSCECRSVHGYIRK